MMFGVTEPIELLGTKSEGENTFGNQQVHCFLKIQTSESDSDQFTG